MSSAAHCLQEGQFLLGFGLEVHMERVACATQRLRVPARRDVQPGLTDVAAEAGEQRFEGGNNRLEVLLPEICPLMVVDRLVDGPLFDIRRAGRSRQGVLALADRANGPKTASPL